MRKLVVLCSFAFSMNASAQVSVGTEGISLAAGTILSVDGLELIPQGNFNVTNTTFQKSAAPINLGGSVYSIANVISLNTPITFTGTIRLHYQDAALNGNDESQLLMAYQSAGLWATSSASAVNTPGNYVEEVVSSKTFDAVTASIIYSSLPVTLTSFTAKRQLTGNVLLQWTTATEQQNSHFIVERSSDGIHYETIGTVRSSGNTTGSAYSYTDNAILSGTNYYRLKQMDVDGHEHLYGVRTVQAGSGVIAVALYPNPVTNTVKLELSAIPAKSINYSIQNVSGQVLQNGIISGREVWLQTSHLPAGVYVLSLDNGQTVRFFKN